MSTLTVAELLGQLSSLDDRGYGACPVYIDTSGDNQQLMRRVYRVSVIVNSQDNLIAAIDGVER